MIYFPKDSPVEVARKAMPSGDGRFPGYDHVYNVLKKAAEYLASGLHTKCGEDHVAVMAAMGSGDEETMKHYSGLAKTYRWGALQETEG